MGKLERQKAYKSTDPLTTVNRIRKILYDNGIFLIESVQRREPVTGVCSCRVIFGDDSLRELDIGSNGKGMDARYALASAYAEFMERLQNGATLWKVLGMPNSVPGAHEVNPKSFKADVKRLMDFAYEDQTIPESLINEVIENSPNRDVITFRNFRTGEALDIPAALYNKMTGSNGMSAGNNELEAIIQGLSEVFERYALHKLFLNQITPPEISEDEFESTDVLFRLRLLGSKGLNFRILDCSLGIGLPVIGLLVEKNNNYHVHFGADPSPITALERCLTEVFQGRTIEELPLYPPFDPQGDLHLMFRNEVLEYTDSSGSVPKWMIEGTPSYSFNGFLHPVTLSDEDDMDYYMQLLDVLGKELYVLNCDILGFPVVRIYVPGLTENHCPKPHDCIIRKVPGLISSSLRRLPLLTDAEFSSLALEVKKWLSNQHNISSADEIPEGNFIGFKYCFPPGRFPVKLWEDSLLIASLYMRGGLSEEGARLLDTYITNKKVPADEAALLRLRLRSRTLTFTPAQWPSCPDCDNCLAATRCSRAEVGELQSRIRNILT